MQQSMSAVDRGARDQYEVIHNGELHSFNFNASTRVQIHAFFHNAERCTEVFSNVDMLGSVSQLRLLLVSTIQPVRFHKV